MIIDGVDVEPFPSHPRNFRKRGEYVNWLMRTFDCPEWVYVAAAGSFELYQEEARRLRG